MDENSRQSTHKRLNETNDKQIVRKNKEQRPLQSQISEQLLSEVISHNNNQNQNQNLRKNQVKKGKILEKKKSFIHVKALISTLILIVGCAAAIFLYTQNIEGVEISQEIMIGICAASYLLYLFFGFYANKLRKYLCTVREKEYFDQYVGQMRNISGFFFMTAECSHEEQKNGQNIKVVSNNYREQYLPTKIEDQTGDIEKFKNDSGKKIAFVHFKVKHYFKDQKSQDQFYKLYDKFKQKYKYDWKQEYAFGFNLPGLAERRAYYFKRSCCKYYTWFHIFGVIGLLWPYSLFVESKINRFQVEFIKVVTVHS